MNRKDIDFPFSEERILFLVDYAKLNERIDLYEYDFMPDEIEYLLLHTALPDSLYLPAHLYWVEGHKVAEVARRAFLSDNRQVMKRIAEAREKVRDTVLMALPEIGKVLVENRINQNIIDRCPMDFEKNKKIRDKKEEENRKK